MAANRSHTDLDLFKRLWAETQSHRLGILVLLVLNLLSAPVTLLIPVPMKIALDNVLGDEPVPDFLAFLVPAGLLSEKSGLLIAATALVVLVGLLMAVQNLGTSLVRTYTGENMMLNFRARLLAHMQRLSSTFHDEKGIADAVYRIQYDATAIQGVMVAGLIPLITALATLLAMIYVILRLDWVLTLIALSIAPLLLVLVQVFRPRLRSKWNQVKEAESAVLGVVEEVLSALRVVVAFGQEAREEDRFNREGRTSISARLRAVVSEGLFGLLLALIIAGGTAAVLYVGVIHVQNDALTLGNFVMVMFYLTILYQPVTTIGSKVASIQNALASADRVYDRLETTPDVREQPGAKGLGRAAGSIVFDRVSFGYRYHEPVLRDISFRVDPGSRVGVAGPTGSGKTSLLNLLPRFQDPTNGSITLDGTDLRELRLSDLRRQYAIVLQESVLFSSSVAENIAYGRPGASYEEIVEAARAANAHGFISKLEAGYETPVGERGMRFSGGQRQLIALARAFLRNAPILILDEPTSSVDIDTEDAVMDALRRLQEGRTTFMIAHRLSTLKYCDVILVLDRGRLVRTETSYLDVVVREPAENDPRS